MNASLYVSSVPQRTSTVQNYNLQCPLRIGNALQCLGEAMKGTHNAINDTLDITFTFNNTMYAGHYLRIIGYCYDKKDVENILLKPCVSGFTSSAAFYNTTTVTLRCDHLDFNYSKTPIMIKELGGNTHGSCLKNNTCTPGCERISDGMHCLVPYTSDKIYQCVLDGAVYNITDIDTVPTPLPDTTTTTQRTTTTVRTTGTSHRTTIPSHGITSLKSTGVNYKTSISVLVGLLVVIFISKECETRTCLICNS